MGKASLEEINFKLKIKTGNNSVPIEVCCWKGGDSKCKGPGAGGKIDWLKNWPFTRVADRVSKRENRLFLC